MCEDCLALVYETQGVSAHRMSDIVRSDNPYQEETDE